MDRRRFLQGIISAPAVVRLSSVMPVKRLPSRSELDWLLLQQRTLLYANPIPIRVWVEQLAAIAEKSRLSAPTLFYPFKVGQ